MVAAINGCHDSMRNAAASFVLWRYADIFPCQQSGPAVMDTVYCYVGRLCICDAAKVAVHASMLVLQRMMLLMIPVAIVVAGSADSTYRC